MKIKLEILGMPELAKNLGRRSEVEFPGGSVHDLLTFLIGRYGVKIEKLLFDKTANLDMTIQVTVNDHFLPREDLRRHQLNDGDCLKLMLLVGGG